TNLSGKFTFTGVHLDQIGELHGTLTSEGHFSGILEAIELLASASTGDLAVQDGRPTPVSGSVQCTTNALNGNLMLSKIEIQTGKRTVEANGTVTGPANMAKQADLDLSATKARVQDMLRPFIKREPPVAGAVAFKGHAHLAPQTDGAKFLQ